MKNKTTQGLGNKNLLSFPKHDSLKYWRLVKVTPVKSLPLTNAKQPNMRIPTHTHMQSLLTVMQCMKQNILNGSMEHAHLI